MPPKTLNNLGNPMLSAAVYGVLQNDVYLDQNGIPEIFGKRAAPIDAQKSSVNGFFARAYEFKSENHVVVAFRGTELNFNSGVQDVLTDVVDVGIRGFVSQSTVPLAGPLLSIVAGSVANSMLSVLGLSQFSAASDFFKRVKRDSGNKMITVCGHSLGGCLAAYVSLEFNVMGATFNRPAMSEGLLASVSIPRKAGAGLLHDFVATDDPCYHKTQFLGGDYTGGKLIEIKTGGGHSSDAARKFLLSHGKGKTAPQLW